MSNLTHRLCRVSSYTGSGIAPLLPAVADLRQRVFQDWPYLYLGDAAYEQEYLKVYADNPRAMLAVAFEGDEIIGASTCMPLIDTAAEIRSPLEARGLDPNLYFYFGESVLLPAYRGRGIGVNFFAARETHALMDGICEYALFYSVRRAADHPARPADFQPLDGFWRNRGYRPVPGLSCQMSWREVGMISETSHTLDAWCKQLKPAP